VAANPLGRGALVAGDAVSFFVEDKEKKKKEKKKARLHWRQRNVRRRASFDQP